MNDQTNDQTNDLNQTEEEILSYTVSDEALEAAAEMERRFSPFSQLTSPPPAGCL